MNIIQISSKFMRNTTSCLLKRTFGTQFSQGAASEATCEIPSNLNLALEKKKPLPRRVFVEPVLPDANGNFILPVMSMKSSESASSVILKGEVFGENLRKDLLQRVVRWQLAKKQTGNHKTKTRSEVSGSGRKAWKQKGSGRARVANIRPPQWRGGYRVHGPVVRDHSFDLPKKVRAKALRVALSNKLREGKLGIIDNLSLNTHKTKEVSQILAQKGWEDILFIHGGSDETEKFNLATRAIPRINLLPSIGANVYSILKRDILIISLDALNELQSRLYVE